MTPGLTLCESQRAAYLPNPTGGLPTKALRIPVPSMNACLVRHRAGRYHRSHQMAGRTSTATVIVCRSPWVTRAATLHLPIQDTWATEHANPIRGQRETHAEDH